MADDGDPGVAALMHGSTLACTATLVPAEGAAGPGARCRYGANCAAGECLPVLDEPRLSFCASVCDSDDSCATGLRCLERACRHPGPSPGALGASCADDGKCLERRCRAGVCMRACFPDLPGFCPPGYACRAEGGENGCFAERNGCS